MSTKRFSARREIEEQIGELGPPSLDERRSVDRRVIGEIMGALLTAITFGALDPQEDNNTSNQATA